MKKILQIFKSDKITKSMMGWAIYDWANSAFATTVMAGFFPVFFKKYWSAGVDVNMSTAQLGLANSLAGLAVALMAPIIGAIADKGTARKKFLIFFAYLGVLMTTSLFFIQKGDWGLASLVYVAGVVGFSGSIIFYDSLLPHVAAEDHIDYASGLGFSLGYLGGGLLLALNVLMILMPDLFGFRDDVIAVKYSFLSVAIWWGGFAALSILWIAEKPRSEPAPLKKHFIIEGLQQFFATFKKIKHLKTVFLFLVAYWLYIDGVDTIIRMAVDYGLSLGFEHTDLIVALLIVQFVGFPATLLYTKIGQVWTVRKAIFMAIGIYILITIWGAQMSQPFEFYVLAILIGCVQGGIQALSRSYFSRLIPKSQSGEFYGFYNMIGKFAVIIGPVLMGAVGLLVKNLLVTDMSTPQEISQISQISSRWSIASVSLLFLLGGLMFYFVDEEKGRREIEHYGNLK